MKLEESVEFDARRLFSCAEVEPPQQADVARKVIVVVIPISASQLQRRGEDGRDLRYQLRLPKSVTVLDHLPKTQTGTNVITQTEDTEKKHATGVKVKVSGEGRINLSFRGVGVNVGGGAERTTEDTVEVKTNLKVDRLPAREQVVVVGTRGRAGPLLRPHVV